MKRTFTITVTEETAQLEVDSLTMCHFPIYKDNFRGEFAHIFAGLGDLVGCFINEIRPHMKAIPDYEEEG
jgi:hypothetical protein